MKKKIVLFLALVIMMLTAFNITIKADEIIVSNDLVVEGAQIRIGGNPGLRFVGKSTYVNEEQSVVEYGFLIAFGNVDYEIINFEAEKVNNKSLLQIKMSTLDEEETGRFYGTITGIPESMLAQDFTARPYLKLENGKIIYGIGTTRNMSQVAYRVSLDEEFEDNEYINSIISKSEKVFTINNKPYKFIQGMTWEEWLDSKYNTSYKDSKFDSLDEYAQWYMHNIFYDTINKWISPFFKYIDKTTIERGEVRYYNISYVLYDGTLWIAEEDDRLQFGGLCFYNKNNELVAWERYVPFSLFGNDWYIRDNNQNTQYRSTVIQADNYRVVYDD